MIKRPILTALGFVAALGALTACQSTQKQSSKGRFEKIDVNKDGKISRDEASDHFVIRVFKSRDKNDDLVLAWQEWNVEGAGASKTRFDSHDTNKDGSISLDEARAYGREDEMLKRAFGGADSDKDGYLSPAEVQDYYGSKEGAPH